jgi:ribonuclease HI
MNIYRAIIRSKLDYGCQVYGSASKTALKMLDPVHHQALRLATGAFRTSPCESLYVEANEPSLSDRRKMLSLQYYIRASKIPDSMVMKHLDNTNLDNRYSNSKRKPKSVAYKIRQIFRELNSEIPEIIPFYSSELGPWEIPKQSICTNLAGNKKEETNPDVYRNLFHAHRHETDIEIYTDGSKSEVGVGAGAIVMIGEQKIEYSQKLNDLASIFTAELLAIKIGLENLGRYRNKTCVLYSDSMSALQAIKSANLDDQRIGSIYDVLVQLKEQNMNIHFCWIPGHAGIQGNEIVDTLAKRACTQAGPISPEVHSSDYKVHIKAIIKEHWEKRWKNLTDNKKLKEIQEGITKKIRKLPRNDDIKITRLRIGHTRLTHSCILIREDWPRCLECEKKLTIKHILMECGNAYLERLACYDHMEVSFKALLNSDIYIPKVLEFIKNIGLYKQI